MYSFDGRAKLRAEEHERELRDTGTKVEEGERVI